jgi:hypothetical protein
VCSDCITCDAFVLYADENFKIIDADKVLRYRIIIYVTGGHNLISQLLQKFRNEGAIPDIRLGRKGNIITPTNYA